MTDLTQGHRPTLGVSDFGVGWVGCECMTTREWHGYLTQHAGPAWEAWLQHVLAAQPPQVDPQPDEREALIEARSLRRAAAEMGDDMWKGVGPNLHLDHYPAAESIRAWLHGRADRAALVEP